MGEPRTVSVNGTRLGYTLLGGGAPLVLLHGFTLDARMWAPQLQAFSSRYAVVNYDQRGYGDSDPATADEPVSHAQDLLALLDHLGLRRVSLVGSSMGGQNAIEFALRYPERVDRLVLASAMLQGWSFSPEMGALFGRIQEALRTGGLAAAKRAWLDTDLFSVAMSRPHSARVLEAIVGDYSGWHWSNASPNVPLDPPMIEQLDRIEAPTLVLIGDKDVADMKRVAERIADEVPGARLEVLEGRGHLPNLEAPKDFNARVLEFLGGSN